uniref:Uncharacterized protein n=1 Tax=Sphaerodactylus townsendi TaxID=933632 RepID=A0ACB8EMD6_9SAUR
MVAAGAGPGPGDELVQDVIPYRRRSRLLWGMVLPLLRCTRSGCGSGAVRPGLAWAAPPRCLRPRFPTAAIAAVHLPSPPGRPLGAFLYGGKGFACLTYARGMPKRMALGDCALLKERERQVDLSLHEAATFQTSDPWYGLPNAAELA